MSTAVPLPLAHGYFVLFVYMFVAQLGIPLPALPLVVAAGAFSAVGRIGAAPAMGVVLVASLCADTVWYRLGRTRGGAVLRMLCRVSLEPEACVRRTQDALGRYGPRLLLFAKFFPGLGLMAAPLAGRTGMRFARFLAFDAAGVLLWASAYGSLGMFLGGWVEKNGLWLGKTARLGAAAVVAAALGLVVVRVLRRRRFRRLLAMPRITVTELKMRLDRGEPVFVVDLRHALLVEADRNSLPGAVHLTPAQLLERKDAIPKDREIVLFCDCPGEASAALAAANLQRSGFPRARPLEGGVEEWKRAGYALARLSEAVAVEGVTESARDRPPRAPQP
jgi:membrane protein DedA with SNARE-associated domain/rhodanese-related sulfurtransferase